MSYFLTGISFVKIKGFGGKWSTSVKRGVFLWQSLTRQQRAFFANLSSDGIIFLQLWDLFFSTADFSSSGKLEQWLVEWKKMLGNKIDIYRKIKYTA